MFALSPSSPNPCLSPNEFKSALNIFGIEAPDIRVITQKKFAAPFPYISRSELFFHFAFMQRYGKSRGIKDSLQLL
jgi:hypothetical protein